MPQTEGPLGPIPGPKGWGPLPVLPGAATEGGGDASAGGGVVSAGGGVVPSAGGVPCAMAVVETRTPINPIAAVNVRMKSLPFAGVVGGQHTKDGHLRK